MKKVQVTSLADGLRYDVDVDEISSANSNADGSTTYNFKRGGGITVSASDGVVIDNARGALVQVLKASAALANDLMGEIKYDSLDNTLEVEYVREDLAGQAVNRAARNAARLEAARLGKAREPYFIVGSFVNGPNAGVFLNNNPLNFILPSKGVPFDCVVYGAMTDAHKTTALFNIARRMRLPRDVAEESMFSRPSKALYLMGDLNVGANRVTVPEWVKWIEPERLFRNEWINLICVGDGAAPDMSKCMIALRSERIYTDDSDEAKLTASEIAGITTQITETEQSFSFRTMAVDYTVPASYQKVQFPKLRGNYLLMGFASGVDSAGGQLVWSTVDVLGRGGQAWSNEPIPITALMSVPSDISEPNLYRLLPTPYLLRNGYSELQLTFAPRAATGAGDYPPNMAADTTGLIYALLKRV